MATVLTRQHQTKMGAEARRLRVSLRITRPELAAMVGISEQTIDLFERNNPVPLDSRRRILKELWAQKNKK